MTVGKRIREARLRIGMTQQELAKKLNISYASVNQCENDRQNPRKATLERYEEVLGLPQGSLISASLSPFSEDVQPLRLNARGNYQLRIGNDELQFIPIPSTESFSDLDLKMLEIFKGLNDDGKEKAIGWMTELCKIPEYQLPVPQEEVPQEQAANQEKFLRLLREHAMSTVPIQEYRIYGPVGHQEVSYSLEDGHLADESLADKQPNVAEVTHMVLQDERKDFWHFLYVPLPATVSQESINEILVNLLDQWDTLETSDRLSIVLPDREVLDRFFDGGLEHYKDVLDRRAGDGRYESAFPRYTSLILVDTETWKVISEKPLVDETE